MDKLLKKRHSLIEAFATLEEAVERYKRYVNDDEWGETTRDSLIQRFEYSIDMLWKYLRHYIQDKKSIEISPSPKDAFTAAKQYSIINEKEYDILTKAIKERNKTSHIYQQEIADILAKEIPNFFTTMQTILNRI